MPINLSSSPTMFTAGVLVIVRIQMMVGIIEAADQIKLRAAMDIEESEMNSALISLHILNYFEQFVTRFSRLALNFKIVDAMKWPIAEGSLKQSKRLMV